MTATPTTPAHNYRQDWPTCYGSGPKPCDVAIFGEAPAWHEVREKQPFVGPSGEVLWTFARRFAGLSRSDVYVSNVVKHCVEGSRTRPSGEKISQEELDYWRADLKAEMQAVQPRFVVALGRYAARAFIGDVTMEECWGLPWLIPHPVFHAEWLTVIPVHHPAHGLHRPSEFQWTAWGLDAAGQIIRGAGPRRPRDEYPKPHYRTSLQHGCGPRVAIDTEGWKDDPWCLQWSDEPGTANLIWASNARSLDSFRKMLLHYRPLVIFHNAPHDLAVLRAMGIDIIGMGLRFADTMTMAANCCDLPLGLKPLAWRLAGMRMKSWRATVGEYDLAVVRRYLQLVVDKQAFWPKPAGREHGIARLAAARLKKEDSAEARDAWLDIDDARRRPVEDVLGPMPRLRRQDVPDAVLVPYACTDADATLRCFAKLSTRVVERDLLKVTQLDTLVLPMVDRMQTIGLPAHRPAVDQLRQELAEREADILDLICTLTGDPDFNPGSGDQVAEWCRQQWIKDHKCGLTRMTKGKMREATDEESLAAIAGDHPAIPLILDWRELNKLRTSYVEKLPRELDADGWYRSDFNTTGVVSGRMAEWILTFPAQTEIGRKCRDCFVAPEGWLFGSADLSQIELRMAAEESGDPVMMQAFADGADLHTRTASLIFHKPESAIDKLTERYPVKTLNFRVLYGGSAQGLSRQLIAMGLKDWLVDKCDRLILDWFEVYAGVERYMRAAGNEGRQHGFVRDRWGRRRYLPALLLDDPKLRNEAERQAGNFKIQSGAQGVIKRAQVRFWQALPALRESGVQVEPVLQYHDEIVVLFKREHEEPVKTALLAAMVADSSAFTVPILSDWTSGPTWGSLKE